MTRNTLGRFAACALSAVLACGMPAFPAAASAPEGSICIVDNGGRGMPSGVFCAEQALKTGLTASVSRDGVQISDDDVLGTGQILTLYSGNGAPVMRREIAVRGDVTGTGSAGLSQLIRVAAALSGRLGVSSAQNAAADFNGSGSIDLSDLAAAAVQLRSAVDSSAVSMSSEVLPMYFRTPNDVTDMPVYYADDQRDIAFLSMDTVEAGIRALLDIVDAEDLTRRDVSDGVVLLERSSGSRAVFDFDEGTILFNSFNAFLLPQYAATVLDPLNTSGLTEEEETWFFGRPQGSFERAGHEVLLDLREAGIPMPTSGGNAYIPLQTFSDFFLVPFGFQAIYNGQMIGIIAGGDPEELGDLYYAAPPRPRSAKLADFMYRELCLVLDSYYGLKEQHDIANFGALFEQTGLKSALTGTDPEASDRALYTLAAGYLGDLHTSFLSPSSYTGRDVQISSSNVSASVRDYHAARVRFQQARLAAYPDGVPGYEEIGDTAYVTIDSLSWYGYDYYDSPPETDDAPDTIGLICYAHRQIMREDSPIRNVVLDLSNSGGGLTDAAIYVLAWFCGDARLDLNDTMTGAQASTVYEADVNLDGRFTVDDTVVSKNRYCLISPLSFSCGNIIPAVLKQDALVTLVGQESGGGACLVLNISTADGSTMQLSGPMRASMLQNGSYYNIDTGITPDVQLALPEQFYDRDMLTARIAQIFR